MNTRFKPTVTYRGDFGYRNSNEAILRFPFPFAEDAYMYSVNIEPHVWADRRQHSTVCSMWTSIMSPNAARGPLCWMEIRAVQGAAAYDGRAVGYA